MDLICHPYPKQLLILLPVHMNNPEITAEQCRNILSWFCSAGSFRVVVLKGSGSNRQLSEDAAVVAAALADLGSSAIDPQESNGDSTDRAQPLVSLQSRPDRPRVKLGSA
jgi:hypothetical protein